MYSGVRSTCLGSNTGRPIYVAVAYLVPEYELCFLHQILNKKFLNCGPPLFSPTRRVTLHYKRHHGHPFAILDSRRRTYDMPPSARIQPTPRCHFRKRSFKMSAVASTPRVTFTPTDDAQSLGNDCPLATTAPSPSHDDPLSRVPNALAVDGIVGDSASITSASGRISPGLPRPSRSIVHPPIGGATVSPVVGSNAAALPRARGSTGAGGRSTMANLPARKKSHFALLKSIPRAFRSASRVSSWRAASEASDVRDGQSSQWALSTGHTYLSGDDMMSERRLDVCSTFPEGHNRERAKRNWRVLRAVLMALGK